MCPIAHVPYYPRCPISICNINHPFTHVLHCPCVPLLMCQKDVKLLKRCQVLKKMSSCQKDVKWQKVKHMDYGRGSQKKLNWHNEVRTYWHQFWHHIWWSPKTLKMFIESVFEQVWSPSYLTSKLMSTCVNLIIYVNLFFFWTSSIVHMFDFFYIWHLYDNWHII